MNNFFLISINICVKNWFNIFIGIFHIFFFLITEQQYVIKYPVKI